MTLTDLHAIITCEHGGKRIPAPLHRLFARHERLLESHRGWDPGSLELARRLSRSLGAPLYAATVSRLVVDLNRSPDSPELFSRITASLPESERKALLRLLYTPYRSVVERAVAANPRGSRVVHISVHSFTPVLRGKRRSMDIGLLFDPSRSFEHGLCLAWRRELARIRPRLRIAFNKPYKGTDDGLTTYLRTKHDNSRYAGIELEVNQRFPRRAGDAWQDLQRDLTASLGTALVSVSPR